MTQKALAIIGTTLCACAASFAAPLLWQGNEGIVISDLGAAASPQANVSTQIDRGKWQVIPYETTRYNGTALYSRRGITPKPVTIDPQLEGWHRIYVAMFSTGGPRIWLRIDGETSPSMLTTGKTGGRWSSTENGEETFWKCADLTGRKITIGKPAGNKDCMVGVMWLRFEPMTEEEIAAAQSEFSHKEDKRLHAHSDMDWIHIYGPNATMDEYCSIIDSYAQSDVECASIEVYTTLCDKTDVEKLYNSEDADLLEFRWPSQLALDKRREAVYREYNRRAKQYGIKLYAAHRMSLSNFLIPHDDICCSNNPFVTNNPQWWCRDRDGEALGYLSYAYPEVGDFMIEQFLKMAEMDFDGVTLLLTRGIEMLFEEPVIARFKELYPDVDPLKLSLDDERLANVRCGIFTDFMRRLRKALDEYSAANERPHLDIFAYVGCGLADNRRLGLDVATWVKEGLVDAVGVACMRIQEDEQYFRDDNDPSLLSVEKYHKMKHTDQNCPIFRQFGNRQGDQLQCIPEYRALSEQYGVKFYYDIQWEGTLQPEQIRQYVQKFYDNGAENLSMWDCFEYRVSYRPEWFVTSRLGHKDALKDMPADNAGYRRLFRILMLNGLRYDGYHPNWRG